ncbi:hypothetical protein ACFL2J_05535 [Candidatus Omnitrophota bacterium]
MEEKAKDLGISVNETVKTLDRFGKFDAQIKGIGGTLHLTKKEDCDKIVSLGWQLAESTGKPVVIVVRATK